MDSAARNYLTLVGTCVVLGAYAVWGSIAFVATPLFSANGGVLDSQLGVLSALVLALLYAISLGRAVAALHRQIAASVRLWRQVQAFALSPPRELVATAKRAGLTGRLTLVDSEEPFSFVFGVLVPRVAISRGFLGNLNADELRAALEHERYHVRNLDPFRALTAKVLSEAFFLLPSLEVLRARYEVARELAADRCAERGCGRRPLLRALLKTLEGPHWQEPAPSASLEGSGLLAARLSRLETGRMPALSVISYSSLAWSTLGALAFLCVFLSAMIGLGGSSALLRAAAYEISPTGISLDALCVAPVVVASLSYWRLVQRASRPLSPITNHP